MASTVKLNKKCMGVREMHTGFTLYSQSVFRKGVIKID